MEQKKVPVSRRAVLARVNRILAKENQAFRISRSYGEKSNLGEAYILDTMRNVVVVHKTSLEEVASDLGAIKSFEEMTEN